MNSLWFNHLSLILQLPDHVVHGGWHIEAIQTGKMVRDVLLLQHQLGRSLQLEGEPPPVCISCYFFGILGLDKLAGKY